MMKNNLPLWIILVSLTIILISIPLQEAYAVAPPDLVSAKTLTTTTLVACFDLTTLDFTTVEAADFEIDGVAVTVQADRNDDGVECGGFDGVTLTKPTGTFATDALPVVRAIAASAIDHAPGGTPITVDDDVTATDGIAPTVSSAATTSSTTIALTMSETVTNDSAVAGDFAIGGVANNPTVTGLAGSGSSTLTLTLNSAIVNIDTPTVTYTQNGRVIDDGGAGNQLAAFADQAVTNLITPTGGSDDIPPSFVTSFDENEYPISIGNTKFTFAELGFNNPTTTVEIGKPVRVNLLMYDDFGPTYITQVELYTNTRGVFSGVSNSDTSIIYKKDSPRIVLDPNGFFSDVILTSSIVNQKLQLTFDITFAKEMEKSDIIVQARDIGNNVGTLTVSDAWQVIPAQAEETAETPSDESADDSVPGEIKVKTLNVEKPAYFMR